METIIASITVIAFVLLMAPMVLLPLFSRDANRPSRRTDVSALPVRKTGPRHATPSPDLAA